jgi:hypothetical protein
VRFHFLHPSNRAAPAARDESGWICAHHAGPLVMEFKLNCQIHHKYIIPLIL